MILSTRLASLRLSSRRVMEWGVWANQGLLNDVLFAEVLDALTLLCKQYDELRKECERKIVMSRRCEDLAHAYYRTEYKQLCREYRAVDRVHYEFHYYGVSATLHKSVSAAGVNSSFSSESDYLSDCSEHGEEDEKSHQQEIISPTPRNGSARRASDGKNAIDCLRDKSQHANAQSASHPSRRRKRSDETSFTSRV